MVEWWARQWRDGAVGATRWLDWVDFPIYLPYLSSLYLSYLPLFPIYIYLTCPCSLYLSYLSLLKAHNILESRDVGQSCHHAYVAWDQRGQRMGEHLVGVGQTGHHALAERLIAEDFRHDHVRGTAQHAWSRAGREVQMRMGEGCYCTMLRSLSRFQVRVRVRVQVPNSGSGSGSGPGLQNCETSPRQSAWHMGMKCRATAVQRIDDPLSQGCRVSGRCAGLRKLRCRWEYTENLTKRLIGYSRSQSSPAYCGEKVGVRARARACV